MVSVFLFVFLRKLRNRTKIPSMKNELKLQTIID
jgi:hypothetical protein